MNRGELKKKGSIGREREETRKGKTKE